MDNQKPSKYFKLSAMETDSDVTIQFLSRDSTEEFCLWDNMTKKYIREGHTFQTTLGELKVDRYFSLKRLTPEEQARWRRVPQFVRRGILNGEEKIFTLTAGAENSLRAQMTTLESVGIDPLTKYYILKKHKDDNKAFVQYSFRASGSPIPAEELNKHKTTQATSEEQELINAVKTDPVANKRTKAEKVKILINNGIAADRAEKLADSYF